MRWVRHVKHTGEKRNAYKFLVGIPKGKRPLKRPMYTWEDNIRMYHWDIEWERVEWMHLLQNWDHVDEPLGSIKGREFFD
jgi:hypothetical protein